MTFEQIKRLTRPRGMSVYYLSVKAPELMQKISELGWKWDSGMRRWRILAKTDDRRISAAREIPGVTIEIGA